MKIKREDLQGVLRRVAPMVKGRTTMPILSCVKVWSLNGGLHATAMDGNVFVEASCNCQGELEPMCVAPNPLLALSGYGPDTLDLSIEKGRLNVKCASMASLSVQDATQFPPWPTEGIKPLGVNTADLANAIDSVSWAADASPRSYAQLNKRTVWIDMTTKEHTLIAMAMDGRRLGFVSNSAIVPNARLIFLAEHASLLIEALRESGSSLSTNESWLVAGGSNFCCAINQVDPFEAPLEQLKTMHKEAAYVGSIPRQATLTELSTMQSLATYEEKVYAKGELSDNGLKLDFVGKTNEFHSVVTTDAASKQHESQCGKDEVGPEPNVHAGAKAKNQKLKAPNPTCFSFDAALLHDVLKHTPGENIPCKIGDRNAFFEGDGVLTALALVRDP